MYGYLDAVIVRGTAWPDSQQIPSWPELTGPADPQRWRAWLQEITRLPGFTAALEQASPALAGRVQDIAAGRDTSARDIRRAVIAALQYLLRASGRATPFGLFAGVAPARLAGNAKIRTGTAHRAVARPPADWLMTVTMQLESEAALWPQLMVMANNLAFERDGYLIIEHRPGSGSSGPEHVRIRATAPVQAAMRRAQTPVGAEDLAAELTTGFPGAPPGAARQLLAGLIGQQYLLTSLRAAMTVTEPFGHLLARLHEAHADQLPQTAHVTATLNRIGTTLAAHNSAATPGAAQAQRTRIAGQIPGMHTGSSSGTLAADLLLDWELAIPEQVAEEAASAANALVRTAARSTLSPGWDAWHARFLDRYGPGAAVPLLDVVNVDTGLGYPAGYPGGAPSPPPGPLTGRDTLLLTLAQHAALRHDQEILLTDQLLSRLTLDRPGAVQPSTELTIRIDAPTTEALDHGDFTLTVLSISRMAGTMTGRFLSLLGDSDRDRMASAYQTRPAISHGAVLVQVSAPPRYAATQDVARSPQVTPMVISLGEYRDGDELIPLDDVAVSASRDRIWLTWLSRQQVLEPVILNAVDPGSHTHPLTRFLAEAPVALATPCTAFDWGAADRLPFLPALRHERTIVSPARWKLSATDLPGQAACWAEWDDALARWRDETALPSSVHLGDGDRRLPLDLAEGAHRALLRNSIDRSGLAVLRPAPSHNTAGWIGGHVHEIVIPLTLTAPLARAPGSMFTGTASRDNGHLPGEAGRWSVRLYGHPARQGDILIRHLPRLLRQLPDGTRWWYLRYHDPRPHLRIRLSHARDALDAAVGTIGQWTRELRSAGLLASTEWDTYFPETARFGGQAAMDAAEAWFAADSAAALAELAAIDTADGPDPRALAAASMLAIAADMTGGTTEAARWMITHTRTGPSPPTRALYKQAIALAAPGALTGLPGSAVIASAWARRRHAATTYRDALPAPLPKSLLPDLLHLHHARLIGPDLTSEAECLHLARAAALSWTARKQASS